MWVTSFGSSQYRYALEALAQSASSRGGADRVVLWTEHDDDLPGSLSYSAYMRDNPALFGVDKAKGGGFYSLKPYIIMRTLQMMKAGDALIYCDSTCLFRHALDLTRFDKSVNLFSLHGASYPNREWTRPELFSLMRAPPEVLNAQQLNAAVQVYNRTAASELFTKHYTDWCRRPEIMRDGPGAQHRHDQSVLSILAAQMPDVLVSEDITQFGPAGDRAAILHHRSPLDAERTFRLDIITPTINRTAAHLMQCVRSVQQQRLPEKMIGRVHHWIVLDGPLADETELRKAISPPRSRIPTRVLKLPVNTGAGGWNGHRIYAAMSHLVDGSWVMWLDEDNWLDPEHVSSMWTLTQTHVDTVFCLRNIVDHGGRYVCRDLCESLGAARASVLDGNDFFSDTSCLMVRRSLAADVSHLWNVRAREVGKPEADRAVSKALFDRMRQMENGALVPTWAATRRATVNYRLGGSAVSVKAAFFENGNRCMHWHPDKRDLYVFHFGPDQTSDLLRAHERGRTEPATLADILEEWQPTMFNSVHAYNLLNGYAHMQVGIPPGSLVYASLCFPQQLPLREVFSRPDLHRMVYTVESPNLAHHQQWRLEFLRSYFDVWMTYWEPLLPEPQALRCWHNTHHLVPDDEGSLAHHLLTNTGGPGSVCIVLSNRAGSKTYSIDGHMLTQLDHMRAHVVKDLNITCHGTGWEQLVSERPNMRLGGSAGKGHDTETSVSIMQRHAFTVIVENCNAENYVSEKLFDCLIAGSICLYYGNVGSVPIPSDVFINISSIGSSAKLQEVINNTDVANMRRNIYDKREQVLMQVSTQAFALSLSKAINMVPPDPYIISQRQKPIEVSPTGKTRC